MSKLISLSVADLFAQAFGYKPKAFEPQFTELQVRKETNSQGTADYYERDEITKREYFLPVELSYEDKSYKLPYPVISISSRKAIIETALTEREETFKELINISGWEIIIRGVAISSQNSNYPEELIGKLTELYRIKKALKIKNAITDTILINKNRGGLDEVVIKDIRFPDRSGVKHARAYELTLVSDAPFNLEEIV